MKWLRAPLVIMFVFMYSYIEAVKAENIHLHRGLQNMQDSYLNNIFAA